MTRLARNELIELGLTCSYPNLTLWQVKSCGQTKMVDEQFRWEIEELNTPELLVNRFGTMLMVP